MVGTEFPHPGYSRTGKFRRRDAKKREFPPSGSPELADLVDLLGSDGFGRFCSDLTDFGRFGPKKLQNRKIPPCRKAVEPKTLWFYKSRAGRWWGPSFPTQDTPELGDSAYLDAKKRGFPPFGMLALRRSLIYKLAR